MRSSRTAAYARFWVEPERREEFEQASEARRAAWAWRRYVGAARAIPDRTIELRYEALVESPHAEAERIAERLDSEPAPLRRAFAEVHGSSVGRWRRDLTSEQVADVEAEAGELLAELGYAELTAIPLTVWTSAIRSARPARSSSPCCGTSGRDAGYPMWSASIGLRGGEATVHVPGHYPGVLARRLRAADARSHRARGSAATSTST